MTNLENTPAPVNQKTEPAKGSHTPAALIAAAPDLLAACDAVLKLLPKLDVVSNYEQVLSKKRAVIDQLRAAVAKAQGGAKVVLPSSAPLPADFVDNDHDGMA